METSKWATPKTEEDHKPSSSKASFSFNPAAAEYSFSPSPAPPITEQPLQWDPPQEDEFASQTRADDDLFGDDFTPIEPEQIVPEQYIPQGPRAERGRGRGRGRGGRGRGGRDSFVVEQSKWADPPQVEAPPATEINWAEAAAIPAARPAAATPADPPASTEEWDPDAIPPPLDQDKPSDTTPIPIAGPTNSDPSVQPAPTAPTGPRLPAAVRGDRSSTGGLKKAKLTESELSERLAAIRLKNASLEAAHARAEADEQTYRERETQAQVEEREKLKRERQNRQQMIGERERNAQRKLKAMGGREWDLEKTEQEEERGARARRGAHGGVVGTRTMGREGRREEPPAEGTNWGVSQEEVSRREAEEYASKQVVGDDWDERPRTPNPVKAWDESLPDPSSFSDPNEPQLPPDDLFSGSRGGSGRGRGGRGRGEGRGGRGGFRGDDGRDSFGGGSRDGRGGRGRGEARGGGGGRGRGNAGFDDRMGSQRKQPVPREEDFPALGGGLAKKPLVMEKSKWATPSAGVGATENKEEKKEKVEVTGDWDKPVANWADDAAGTKSADATPKIQW